MIEETDSTTITLLLDGTLYVDSNDENGMHKDENIFHRDVISFIVFSSHQDSFVFMTSDRSLFYVFEGIKHQIQPVLDGIPDTIIHYHEYLSSLVLISDRTVYCYSINRHNVVLQKTIDIGPINLFRTYHNIFFALRTDDNRLFWAGKNNSNCFNLVEVIPKVDYPVEFIANIEDIKINDIYLVNNNIYVVYFRDMRIMQISYPSYTSETKTIDMNFHDFDDYMFNNKKYEYMPLIKSIHSVYVHKECGVCFITEDNCLWKMSNYDKSFELIVNDVSHVYLALIDYSASIDVKNIFSGVYFVCDINGNNKCYLDNCYAKLITEQEWPFPQNLLPTNNFIYQEDSTSPYKLEIVMDDNSVYGLIHGSLKFERISYYDDKPLMPKHPLIKQRSLKSARTSSNNC